MRKSVAKQKISKQKKVKKFPKLRLTVLHTFEFIALVMVIFLVLFGVLSWQLSKGPISLAAFTPDAQRALLRVFGGEVAHIGKLQADWSRAEKALVIAASDVEIYDRNGQAILHIPRFEAGLSGLSLLRGRLELSRLIAIGGEISVVRRQGGAIGVGVGNPTQVLANSRVWEQGKTPAKGINAPLIRRAISHLQVLTIRNTTLHLSDLRSGIRWRAPNAQLSFSRVGDRIEFSADGRIQSNGQQSLLQFSGTSYQDFSMLSATASFADLIPAQLVPDIGPLAIFHQMNAPVSSSISVHTDAAGLLTHADFEMKAGAGSIVLSTREIILNEGILRASYNAETGTIEIDQALLDGPKNHLDVKGQVQGLDPARLVIGEQIKFDLDFAPLQFDFTGFMPGLTRLDDLQITGQYWPKEKKLIVPKWSVAADDLSFAGSAQINWIALDDESGWFQRTKVKGQSKGSATYEQILSFWPVDTAEGVRTWSKQNFKSATLRDFVLDLNVDERVRDAGGLLDDMLRLSFAFDQLETSYFGTMPPITSAKGSALLLGNRFDVQMQSGQLLDSKLSQGYVHIPYLHPIGAVAEYGATANGSLSDLLSLLDNKPFGYASMYKIVPENVRGTGEVKFELRRPMRTHVPWKDLGFSAIGGYTNVAASALLLDQDIENIDLTFAADQNAMHVTGQGFIGPWPSSFTWGENFKAGDQLRTNLAIETRVNASLFDGLGLPTRDFFFGDIGLHLEMSGNGLEISRGKVKADLLDAFIDLPGPGWEKPKGAPGSLAFEIKETAKHEYTLDQLQLLADGLDVQGMLRYSTKHGLQDLQLTTANMQGAFDFTAGITRDQTDGFVINANVAEADISHFVRTMAGRGKSAIALPLTANIEFKNTIAGDRLSFDEGHLQFRQTAKQIEMLEFVAHSKEGVHDLYIRPDAYGNGVLEGSSIDGGAVLQALFGVEGVIGGQFTVQGAINADQEQPSTYSLSMDNFQLNNTPVVAKILSLGSLRGLSDTLSGSGMLFNKMEIPMQSQNGFLQIRNARATGPAMGVTLDGDVDMASKKLQLQGTLAPAYTLNSILGALPVVGDILVPREGEGVFGLTYSVTGPFREMQVSVNPLSAFTPGVLRQMFGKDLPKRLDDDAGAKGTKAPIIPEQNGP